MILRFLLSFDEGGLKKKKKDKEKKKKYKNIGKKRD